MRLNQMSDTNSKSLDLKTDAIYRLATIIKKCKGTINVLVEDNPAVTLSLTSSTIVLDIHDSSIFGNLNNEKEGPSGSFFENLKTLRKIGEFLNSNGLTLIVSRKGKEAFTLGRDATPTVSSMITGSDDIHVDSLTQVSKLGKDLSKSWKSNKSND